MIADHATEPTALIAHVRDVIANIRRRSNTNRDTLWVTTYALSGFVHSLDCPLRNVCVGELQDKSVSNFSGERKSLWPICGNPYFKFTLGSPRKTNARAVVVNCSAVAKFANDMNALAQCCKVCWLSVCNAHSRVATTDSAHSAVAIHLVKRRIYAGSDCPVARCRVGDHWSNNDVACLGQDLAINHIRFLPQNVTIKSPYVRKAIHVGLFCKVDHARRWWGRL